MRYEKQVWQNVSSVVYMINSTSQWNTSPTQLHNKIQFALCRHHKMSYGVPLCQSTDLLAKGALLLLLFITFNLLIGIVFGVLHNQVHSGINFFTYNTLEWGQIQTNFWWVFTLRKKNHHFCSLFDLIDRLHKWRPKKISYCLCANKTH